MDIADISKTKRFASALLDGYKLLPDKVRVGLSIFGDQVEQDLTFADAANLEFTKERLDQLGRIRGEPRLDKVIQFADSTIFTPGSGSRAGAGRVLVIFTKSSSQKFFNDLSSLTEPLKQKGVKIVVVGIDHTPSDTDALKVITGSPNDVVPVGSISNLPEVFGIVERKITDAVCK